MRGSTVVVTLVPLVIERSWSGNYSFPAMALGMTVNGTR